MATNVPKAGAFKPKIEGYFAVSRVPWLAAQVARHMDAAAGTLDAKAGLESDHYRDALLSRFANPEIAHETYQIAMDGSQKMPQRIFAAALDAAQTGQDLTSFAFATACWARYLAGRTDDGVSYDLRDPRETELTRLPVANENRIAALFALTDLVPPELSAHGVFRTKTVAWLDTISERGVLGALEETANV